MATTVLKNISLAMIVVFGAALLIFHGHYFGYRAFTVLTASMEPAILRGSLIVTHWVKPETLRVGDVITFMRPDRHGEYVTHRIDSIKQNGSVQVFTTKGDKNQTTDAWLVAAGGVVGKTEAVIPWLGKLLFLMQTKIAIVLCVILPSAYVEFNELRTLYTLWRSPKKPLTPVLACALVATNLILVQATGAVLTGSASLNQLKVITRAK